MSQQTALVTGGMGGIGTVIARHLADAGINVAVTYNKRGKHELAEEWRAAQSQDGYNFATLYVDVTNFASAAEMVNNAVQQLGHIDILVNNAGITADTTLLKMTPAQWYGVIDNNLNSIFNITQNVLQDMIKNQYGRIINISSINGQKGAVRAN